MSISLKKDGYEVVETEEGSQTVEAYQTALTQGQRFDLVITDLSIPNGMGGAEAMQQIRFADPDVVAVVSSGYSDDPVMANYTQFGFSAVLPKPYKPSTLRQLAHRLIKGEQLAID
jgi:CheY-like chemotaxis protein